MHWSSSLVQNNINTGGAGQSAWVCGPHIDNLRLTTRKRLIMLTMRWQVLENVCNRQCLLRMSLYCVPVIIGEHRQSPMDKNAPCKTGPRNCVAQPFAIMEGTIILAARIRRFHWVLHTLSYDHFALLPFCCLSVAFKCISVQGYIIPVYIRCWISAAYPEDMLVSTCGDR